jgi:PKD repeat protein
MTVEFNDTTTSGTAITSYNASFGDGSWRNDTTFPATNITHLYSTAGNYTVDWYVTNAEGTGSANTTITVSDNLVSNFTYVPSGGNVPFLVTFTDTSTNATALIDSWYWVFGDQGDGNTSSLQNPTHTYTVAGTYITNLTIRNTTYDLTSTKLQTIIANATLSAAFTGIPTSGGVPLGVSFTDDSTGVRTNWLWTFGDGNISTLQNPTHTYVNPGSYNVDLNITGPDGTTNLTKNAYITATDAPTANWSADKYYGVAPLPVTFTDASTGAGITWDWDFGDGNTSAFQSPSHTFVSNGEYQVNLTVTNTFGSSTKLRNITVTDLISSYSGYPAAGPYPLEVTFTETSTGLLPDTYYYDFGDGNTSTLQNPTHTFPHMGYYTISNRITNGTYEYWNNKTNYIEAYGITPSFSVSNTTATNNAPLVVAFTDTSTTLNATVDEYLWVFGDGTQSTDASPVHIYDTDFGSFYANLTVSSTSQGISYTSPSTQLTRIPSNLVANISYNWVMNQIFPTTIMVKDSQTLALIGGTSVTVDGVTYILDNGILSNYFEYGPHTFFVESEGYASKTTSLFIVGNSTFTILLDPISGASQTTWWTPHTVQLTVMSDSYGTRLPNVLVEAYYNESAMPTAWIETLYGIQSTAAGQMLNQSLTLGGTTGSDGTLTTSMLGSLKYDIYLTSAEYGLNRYHVSTYPSDYMLNIYVPVTGQTLPTSGNNTYVYLNNTRLYMTQPNISYVNFCIDYQDFSGTTSTVSELWWFGNNNSIFGTASFINPGTSLVTNCKTLYNVRGTPVYWNYSAVTGI